MACQYPAACDFACATFKITPESAPNTPCPCRSSRPRSPRSTRTCPPRGHTCRVPSSRRGTGCHARPSRGGPRRSRCGSPSRRASCAGRPHSGSASGCSRRQTTRARVIGGWWMVLVVSVRLSLVDSITHLLPLPRSKPYIPRRFTHAAPHDIVIPGPSEGGRRGGQVSTTIQRTQ